MKWLMAAVTHVLNTQLGRAHHLPNWHSPPIFTLRVWAWPCRLNRWIHQQGGFHGLGACCSHLMRGIAQR
jgi:hypothetical protein